MTAGMLLPPLLQKKTPPPGFGRKSFRFFHSRQKKKTQTSVCVIDGTCQSGGGGTVRNGKDDPIEISCLPLLVPAPKREREEGGR